MQYAGCGYKNYHGLRYRLYLLPEDVHLKDAIAPAYSSSTWRNEQDEPKDFPGDVRLIYSSNEKRDADDNVSSNKVTIEITGDGA